MNSGTARAPKVLHRLLGMGEGTRITDVTLAAVKRHDAVSLVTRLCDERLAFLKNLKTWPVFGKGWNRRVAEVRAAALALARGEQRAVEAGPAAGKGAAPLNSTAQKTSAGTIAATGAAGAVVAQQAGTSMSTILVVMIATLILAALGWFVWTWLRDRRQDEALQEAGTHDTPSLLVRAFDVLKGWKTVIFGGALTAAGAALDLLDQLRTIDIAPLLPPGAAVKIIAAIGVVTILLRLATTSRVGRKDS